MNDKILADIRNKLTPIKNLIAMLNEIQKSKKCVEYICDIS